MNRMLLASSRLGIVILAVVAICALPAAAVPSTVPDDAPTVSPDYVQTQQYHWSSVHLPGGFAARQSVTAWQVTHGQWQGETLDGLTLVLVQSTIDSGAGQRLINCYVSSQATLAQRQALVSAFLATQPGAVPRTADMRIEPAVITLQIDGQTVVLHLGLIA